MPTPIEDSETLLAEIVPLARSTMETEGELRPLAVAIDAAGQLRWLALPAGVTGAGDGLALLLEEGIGGLAGAGDAMAAALAYPAQVNMPDSGEVGDAIVISLAHRDGYSVDLHYPFSRDGGRLVWGQVFAGESQANLLGPRVQAGLR